MGRHTLQSTPADTLTLVSPTRNGRPIEAPPFVYRLAESRAWFELGAFAAAAPLLRAIGRGDRHPVLVLPGFTDRPPECAVGPAPDSKHT